MLQHHEKQGNDTQTCVEGEARQVGEVKLLRIEHVTHEGHQQENHAYNERAPDDGRFFGELQVVGCVVFHSRKTLTAVGLLVLSWALRCVGGSSGRTGLCTPRFLNGAKF